MKIFAKLSVLAIVAVLSGACATSKILAENSVPDINLMNGADNCARHTQQAKIDACLVGVNASATVAIENGRSAAEAVKASQPVYSPFFSGGFSNAYGTNHPGDSGASLRQARPVYGYGSPSSSGAYGGQAGHAADSGASSRNQRPSATPSPTPSK